MVHLVAGGDNFGEPAGSGLPGLTRRGRRGRISVRRILYATERLSYVVSWIEGCVGTPHDGFELIEHDFASID